MRVVCIDDDKTFLTIYKKVLEKHLQPEDELTVTMNPAEVINIATSTGMDVLITDLVMPQVTGLDLLAEVKSKVPGVEVIVVTGQGSIDSAVEAMRLGARDYLTKPINSEMLVEKLGNIREFINREKEAEDYRFAKETIEENAMRTVAEMEIKLDGYISLVYDTGKVLESNESDTDKLAKIKELLASVR